MPEYQSAFLHRLHNILWRPHDPIVARFYLWHLHRQLPDHDQHAVGQLDWPKQILFVFFLWMHEKNQQKNLDFYGHHPVD